ncbi:MAG: TldD/PmbA family protein [Candidatus Methanomethylicaceae archaeon]
MKDRLLAVGEKIMNGLLQKGAEKVIVLPVHRDRTMIRFSNNKTTVIQNWSVLSVEFLCTFGRKRLISRIENASEDAIMRSVERVVAEAKFVPEDKEFVPIPEGRKYRPMFAGEKIRADIMVDGVRAAINAALREGAERVAGVYTGDITARCILSSRGAEGYDERTAFELNVRGLRGEASGQGLSCGNSIRMIDAERAGGEAGSIVKESGNFVKWSEGRYKMLLGPIIAANLLEHLGEASSAFMVDAGLSCLAGKVGEKVLSEKLTIVDDGKNENGLHSRAFDDEGIETRKNSIIEEGIVKGYLHNTKTASKFKTESTGNAGWIIPSAWNLVVEGGDLSFEEALGCIKNGIYVVSNWYTRFQNYSTGDFSTICRDGVFLIEDGELRGALKGVRISDNLIRLFNSIEAVCKERRWVKWWEVRTPAYLPAMIATDVTITKAQGA